MHEEAVDLIPKIEYWKYNFSAENSKLCPAEEGDDVKTTHRSTAVKNRRSLQHVIKRRISTRYRAFRSCPEKNTFSVTTSHSRLMYYFTMEYLVKGQDGLPIYEEMEDPADADDGYERRVKQHYLGKPRDYELMVGEQVTRTTRAQYRMKVQENKLKKDSIEKELAIFKSDAKLGLQPVVVMKKLSQAEISTGVATTEDSDTADSIAVPAPVVLGNTWVINENGELALEIHLPDADVLIE